MIEISRLRLSLPHGFENRANRIGRLVGVELQNASVTKSQSISGIRIPDINARPSQSDAEIAKKIASSIMNQLKAL